MTRPRLFALCAVIAVAVLVLLTGTALALRDSPPDLGPAVEVGRGTPGSPDSSPTPRQSAEPSGEPSATEPGASPVRPATPPPAGDDDDDDDDDDD